jgi:hypothetical protein
LNEILTRLGISIQYSGDDLHTALVSFLSNLTNCESTIGQYTANQIYTQINNDFNKMNNVFNVTISRSVYQYTISSIVSNLTDFSYTKESKNGQATTVLTSNVTLSNGHLSLNEEVKFTVSFNNFSFLLVLATQMMV